MKVLVQKVCPILKENGVSETFLVDPRKDENNQSRFCQTGDRCIRIELVTDRYIKPNGPFWYEVRCDGCREKTETAFCKKARAVES